MLLLLVLFLLVIVFLSLFVALSLRRGVCEQGGRPAERVAR